MGIQISGTAPSVGIMVADTMMKNIVLTANMHKKFLRNFDSVGLRALFNAWNMFLSLDEHICGIH